MNDAIDPKVAAVLTVLAADGLPLALAAEATHDPEGAIRRAWNETADWGALLTVGGYLYGSSECMDRVYNNIGDFDVADVKIDDFYHAEMCEMIRATVPCPTLADVLGVDWSALFSRSTLAVDDLFGPDGNAP